jgi:hypothetical protein
METADERRGQGSGTGGSAADYLDDNPRISLLPSHACADWVPFSSDLRFCRRWHRPISKFASKRGGAPTYRCAVSRGGLGEPLSTHSADPELAEEMVMTKPLIFLSHINEEAELAGLFKAEIEKVFLGMIEVFVSSEEASISVGSNWTGIRSGPS